VYDATVSHSKGLDNVVSKRFSLEGIMHAWTAGASSLQSYLT